MFGCRLLACIWLFSSTAGLAKGRAAEEHAELQQESKGSEAYEAALIDYRATKTKEAARRLKSILQKDPNNREAAMLLGTIYFDNQKQKRALMWFEHSDISVLSNETAFAWGSVYLESGDSKKAIAGFRFLLKNKGPFRPFANYYLGVAYYNLGQWSRARKFLLKVKSEDLPVTLRVNRRRYLSEVRRQQDKMLESVIGVRAKRGLDLGVAVPTEDAELPPSIESASDDVHDVAKKSPKIADRGEIRKGLRQNLKPFLAVMQQSLALDNHNQSRDSVSLFAHREGLAGSLSHGHRSYPSGIDYSLGNIAYSARFDQTDYLSLDETSGVFATQASENSSLNSNFVTVETHLSWVMSDKLRLDFIVGVQAYLPNSNLVSRWGQSSQQLGLKFEAEDTEFALEATFLQPFDAPRNLSALDYSTKADVEREFGDVRVSLQGYANGSDQPNFLTVDRLQLILADPQLRDRTGFGQEIGGSGTIFFSIYESSLQLRAEAYNRTSDANTTVYRLSSTESIEGAVYGAGKTLVSLSLPLWDSASLTAAAGYNQFSGYHFLAQNEDATKVFSATTAVEQIMFQGSGAIAFAEWIRLNASYTVTTNSYLSPSAEDPIFRRSNPDYVIDSNFYLEISKTF